MILTPTKTPKSIAVVGAGPAGLSAATTAARRGHTVTLFEASKKIGGQFNIAKRIPGKEEFHETIRYFAKEIDLSGVDVRLNTRADQDLLARFDEVIVATGVLPRTPAIDGIDHPKVLGYLDVMDGAKVGQNVAVIGAGGIGFDISEFLIHDGPSSATHLSQFIQEWGIDMSLSARGGVEGMSAKFKGPARNITLLQRKAKKVGAGLGKTTGWIHRANLTKRGVHMMSGVQYDKIDDAGLHITVGDRQQVLDVDHVIICAGQEPLRELEGMHPKTHLIGGADVASELDARSAIDQGTRLALEI